MAGRYLIVITKSDIVAQIGSHTIRRVTKTKVIPFAHDVNAVVRTVDERHDENEYLRLLDIILGCGAFHFSTTYDITHTTARIQAILSDPKESKLPLWKRADPRFFWNRFLSQDLIYNNLDSWILPLMNGFVETDSAQINGTKFTFALISRRSWRRTGKRFTSRGLNRQGHASNFAETEQLVMIPDSPGKGSTRVLSYVQTRGSIPLFWRQRSTLRYMPTPALQGDDSSREKAFKLHFRDQKAFYGRQVLINLIDQKGKELVLVEAFTKQVDRVNDPEIRLVNFDFHKECKGMKYENIGKLVAQIEDEFTSMGYFDAVQRGDEFSVSKRQQSAIRTNCMDCLDRTNVVQSVFARKVLVAQFKAAGVIPSNDTGATFKDASFERLFKNVWANNADAMSFQYSGTGALKTDYTRTGKRTKKGAISDLRNSAMRYYLNNFHDGNFQDALDLFLGLYMPEPKQKSPLSLRRKAASETLPQFVLKMSFFFLIAFLTLAFLAPYVGLPSIGQNTFLFLYFCVFPVVVFKIAEKKGQTGLFVNHPVLRSDEDLHPR